MRTKSDTYLPVEMVKTFIITEQIAKTQFITRKHN